MAGEICQHTVTGKDGQTFVCGQVHNPARCRAHVKVREPGAGGRRDPSQPVIGVRPCKKGPMSGQKVCDLHGGRSPQAKARAEVRVAEETMRRAVETYGLPVDTDPVEALLDEVRWTAGHVAWLRERVQELEQEQLVWGKTKTDEQQATEFPGVNTTEAAVPNVFLTLYQAERKHLVDVCKTAIAAKIDERRVRLAEQQGEMLASVIKAILDDLGLTPEQTAKVPEVVPRHLRAVA